MRLQAWAEPKKFTAWVGGEVVAFVEYEGDDKWRALGDDRTYPTAYDAALIYQRNRIEQLRADKLEAELTGRVK